MPKKTALKNLMELRIPAQLLLLLATTLVLAAAAAQNELDTDTVVVRPIENHDVLVNPGTGITTFQRFNGDPLNPGLEWSEEGPTAKSAAPQAPTDFPDTSIAYCRWFWDVIEPAPGRFGARCT
jgi:hypothetical protein